MHDFQCDTGLAIGLGVYTHTDLVWDEQSTFSISNFVAGAALGGVDTDSLPTPYNAAQSKPVHIVWEYLQSEFSKTFLSSMTNRPSTVEHSCILGVDGYAMDSSFGEYEPDNTDCDDVVSGTTLSAASLMKSGQIPMALQSAERVQYDNLGLVLFAVLGLAVLFGMWAVIRAGMKGLASSSKVRAASNEEDPLLQSL